MLWARQSHLAKGRWTNGDRVKPAYQTFPEEKLYIIYKGRTTTGRTEGRTDGERTGDDDGTDDVDRTDTTDVRTDDGRR